MSHHSIQGENRYGKSDFRAMCEALANEAVQLDAGMHPAKEGFAALPFFDEFDLSTVDILLLSQYVTPRSLFV